MAIINSITGSRSAVFSRKPNIRARRSDGYHELETLFAFVEFGDEVSVEAAEADSFTVTGPFAAGLAGEGDNLVTRAAARFSDRFGGGAHSITLEKRLPVASGIGGGSADAAATLRALGRLHGVSVEAMVDIADSLGCEDQFRAAFLLGCVGAWSLHPNQIAIAKKVFSPPVDEVLFAKKVLAAIPDGRGVHMIDGKMQDDATWKQCKVMVDLAESLARKDPELAEAYGL